jgi:predicted nucleic acid-binding protein
VYLFDTDTISHLLIKNPPSGLIKKVAAVPSDQQFTSAITVGEMIYGAYRSTRPDFFLEKLDRLVWPNITILPFDEAAARAYGPLRARLERAGTPVSEPDLRIASIALNRQLTLITGNIRHFSRIPGLSIENWIR